MTAYYFLSSSFIATCYFFMYTQLLGAVQPEEFCMCSCRPSQWETCLGIPDDYSNVTVLNASTNEMEKEQIQGVLAFGEIPVNNYFFLKNKVSFALSTLNVITVFLNYHMIKLLEHCVTCML